jgi:Amt family ammonium transporter
LYDVLKPASPAAANTRVTAPTSKLGFFADKSATGAGTDGVFFGGGWGLLADQVVAVAAVLLFSGVASWILAVAIDKTMGLRVSSEAEQIGLDQTQHAEAAYQS